MEKRNHLLQSIIVLLALFCGSVTAMAQSNASPASVSEADTQAPITLKSRAQTPALIPMSTRIGDVNCDGLVNIDDVTTLVNLLLKRQGNTSYADVDQDGLVSISDVTELIKMLLKGGSKYDMSSALAALHEVYQSMHLAGWSTSGNYHQSFGISAYNLAAEVMGDDMIMGAQGSGWFWFDAAYSVKQRYTSNAWRSNDLWTAHYTWIANANYLLEASRSMTGSTEQVNYVKGQAYAIRAYSYFMLAQWFARTYKGHESDPCVPLFTGTVWNGSTGALRSTVAEVYAQIDADITQAVNLLKSTTQTSSEHIGHAVALGLQARISLVKEDWTTAYNAAVAAINASGKDVQEVSAFTGVNNVRAGNVMWGADIPAEEVGMYASFWAHMCTSVTYGQRSPKQITKWLYNKMSSTDARLAWWDPQSGYSTGGYVQQKFDVLPDTEWDGDYIWMRVEEMFLTAAEAACHRGLTTTAKNYLTRLMSKRDPNYSCSKTGTELGALTTDETGSLLEEILIQRRIELWGEDGRIYTIRRLRQGFTRAEGDGWPNQLMYNNHSDAWADPESYAWVMTIPQSEYYNYYARLIDGVDQNPMGDYPEGTAENIERTPQHISFVEASQTVTVTPQEQKAVTIRLTRPQATAKPYKALIGVSRGNLPFYTFIYASFPSNSKNGTATLYIKEQESGNYTYKLSLTDLEMSVAGSSQLTTSTINVDCHNIEPEGQNISFTMASQEITLSEDELTANYYYMAVPLTRAISTHQYVASLSISDTVGNVYLSDQYVVFNEGENTADVAVCFDDLVPGNTYSCKLSLSDEDVATADPTLEQITTTTITFNYTKSNWVNASTCSFTDYTWYDGQAYSADNVPIQRLENAPNTYRIISPLYYVYNGIESNPSTANWTFTLNADGSILPVEGQWDLNYWGYYGYYNTSQYSTYCYVNRDGNTYDVYFILKTGTNLYSGGHFSFTWNR